MILRIHIDFDIENFILGCFVLLCQIKIRIINFGIPKISE